MSVHVSIRGPVQQLEMNRSLVLKVTDAFSVEDWLRSPGADSSSGLWLAGHVVNSRAGLARMIGIERDSYHPELFGRGTALRAAECPPIGEVLGVFDEVTAQLAARFQDLTEAQLAVDAPREFPIPDKSLAGAVAFLAFHETYHVGQLAYLHKWLGRGSLVG